MNINKKKKTFKQVKVSEVITEINKIKYRFW